MCVRPRPSTTRAPSGSGGYRHDGGLTVAPSHAIQVSLGADDQMAAVDLGLQAGPDAGRRRTSVLLGNLHGHLVEGEPLGDQAVMEALVQGVGGAAIALGGSLDLESSAHATAPSVL